MSVPETTVKMQVIQVRVAAAKAGDMVEDDSKGKKVNTLPLNTALWEMEWFRTWPRFSAGRSGWNPTDTMWKQGRPTTVPSSVLIKLDWWDRWDMCQRCQVNSCKSRSLEGAGDRQRNHPTEDTLSSGVGDAIEMPLWKESPWHGIHTNTDSRG